MLRNEKGFTSPLCLSLLLLISLLFVIQMEVYLNEKRIAAENHLLLKQEYYFMNTVKYAEKMMRSEEKPIVSGYRSFSEGEVSFHSSVHADHVYIVNFRMKLKTGNTINGLGYYDNTMKKMIKWVEKI